MSEEFVKGTVVRTAYSARIGVVVTAPNSLDCALVHVIGASAPVLYHLSVLEFVASPPPPALPEGISRDGDIFTYDDTGDFMYRSSGQFRHVRGGVLSSTSMRAFTKLLEMEERGELA